MATVNSIVEVLLIELLRREKIISDKEAATVSSIKSLFLLLEKMKTIPPLSKKDKKIIREWEKLICSSLSLSVKYEKATKQDLSQIENEALKRILISLTNKLRELLRNGKRSN